jgi:hypothetical protein
VYPIDHPSTQSAHRTAALRRKDHHFPTRATLSPPWGFAPTELLTTSLHPVTYRERTVDLHGSEEFVHQTLSTSTARRESCSWPST